MRRALLGSGIGSIVAGLLLACVGSDADPSTSSSSSSGGGGADGGGASEAATDSGAVSADAPSGGNLVARSDFEGASCAGWDRNQATRDLDPEHHSGAGSCRACASPGNDSPVWGIFQTLDPAVPAGTYTVTAFAHPYGDAGPFHVNIRAEYRDETGASMDPQRRIDIVPGDSWQTKSFDLELRNPGGTSVSLAILTDDVTSGCFLVDDVTLTPKK